MTAPNRGRLVLVVLAVAVLLAGAVVWYATRRTGPEGDLVSGNGRIEATEVDVAARAGGRVLEILAAEGDFVKAGQVVARMQTDVLEAQRDEARAGHQRALHGVEAASAQVDARESDVVTARAVVRQRQAELEASRRQLARTELLARQEARTAQDLEDAVVRARSAEAAVILAGAALIREREHGTVEHLLVMPVTFAEIMLAKIWSAGVVVLLAAGLSLTLVVRGALHVPVQGSVALFLAVSAVHLFATTSMGVAMATMARSMPQFGMLFMLTVMPLQILSGGMTPRESMPAFVRTVMYAAPTTHYVSASQAILFRGAGLDIVWSHLLALAAIGFACFGTALARFRKTLSQAD